MWFDVREVTLDWEGATSERLEIDVPMPADEVWRRYIADPASWPRWFHGMAEARFVGDGGGHVGALRRVRLKDGMEVEEKILAWDPGRRFAFAIVGANRPLLAAMTESYTFMPREGGCRFVYEIRYQLVWWLRPLGRLVHRQFRPMFQAATDALAATAAQDRAAD